MPRYVAPQDNPLSSEDFYRSYPDVDTSTRWELRQLRNHCRICLADRVRICGFSLGCTVLCDHCSEGLYSHISWGYVERAYGRRKWRQVAQHLQDYIDMAKRALGPIQSLQVLRQTTDGLVQVQQMPMQSNQAIWGDFRNAR
jgi:hypothetical protein